MAREGRRVAGAIAVTLAIFASACTSSSEAEPTRAPTPAAMGGGTLRLAVPEFPHLILLGDLDPQRTYVGEAWAIFRCCLLRTLLSYSGQPTDEGGADLRPDLAGAMPEVSADGLTWTFGLRPGLRYAPPYEDTGVVAGDIVRALEREARVGGRAHAYLYSAISGFEEYAAGEAVSIAGLETPDARTLVVRLHEPASDLAYRFSLAATAPIPPGAAEGHDEGYGRFLAASGPYMIEGSGDLDPTLPPRRQQPFSGFVPAVLKEGAGTEIGSLTLEEDVVVAPGSLTLVRNPSWDPATDDLRPAYPDRIEVALGVDQDELATAVEQGELDMVFGLSATAEQIERYQEDPTLADRLFIDPKNNIYYVTLNLAVPPFDDVHVRRAVNLAIDKAGLVELLAQPRDDPFGLSVGIVATHIAPDSLEGNLLSGYNPYAHDLARARAEMRLSRYDTDGDGRCDAHVCRSILAPVSDLLPSGSGRSIRSDLAAIGIGLDLQPTPFDPFFQRLRDPLERIPMGIGAGWGQDYPSGSGWFPGLFASEQREVGANYSLLGATPEQLRAWGYSVTTVPSVDDRLDRCLSLLGSAQSECWTDLDQYLMAEIVPWVPLLTETHAQVVSERVVGYSFDQFSTQAAFDRIQLAPGSS